MRLQKEEKIAVVLLLMAFSSLAIATWAIGGLDQSSTAKANPVVSVEGTVINLNPTKSGGNLLIQLDSTPTVIFVARDSGAKDVISRVKIGDKIRAKGRPTEFQGSREIKVDRSQDIVVINADGD